MRSIGVLLILAILLLLLWGGGFAFHVAGGLIHLLLVIALVVFILHFVRGGEAFDAMAVTERTLTIAIES
jgi:hypothetical protein